MIINEPFTFVKQSVGFKKGETEVIDFLNNLILKYLKSGVINNLLKKHNVQKKLSLPKIN